MSNGNCISKRKHGNINKKKNENVQRVVWVNVIQMWLELKAKYRFVDNASIFYVKLISSSRLYISSSDTIEVTTVDFYQSSTAHQRNIIFASQGFLV